MTPQSRREAPAAERRAAVRGAAWLVGAALLAVGFVAGRASSGPAPVEAVAVAEPPPAWPRSPFGPSPASESGAAVPGAASAAAPECDGGARGVPPRPRDGPAAEAGSRAPPPRPEPTDATDVSPTPVVAGADDPPAEEDAAAPANGAGVVVPPAEDQGASVDLVEQELRAAPPGDGEPGTTGADPGLMAHERAEARS